ncbi:flagellar hook-basal body complex protein [Peribacillus alkalitolerans]|uniref:flagellar hook-basal body complex protein n=1 Tax=Peribacillus alkalitolerans TaxID=1550385 RepID=UPI003B84712A
MDENGISRSTTIYFKKLSQDNWGVYTKEPLEATAIPTGGLKADLSVYTGSNKVKWDLRYTGTAGSEYSLTDGTNTIPLTVTASKKLILPNPVNLTHKTLLAGLQLDVSSIEKPASVTSTQLIGNTGNFKVNIPTSYTPSTDTNYSITYTAAVPPVPGPAAPESYNISVNGAPATTITWNASGKFVTAEGVEIDKNGLSPNDGDTWIIDAKAKTPQVPNPATTPIASIEVNPATKEDHKLTFVNGKIPNDKSTITMDLSIPSGFKDDVDTVTNESIQILKGIKFDFSKLTQEDGSMTALINPDGNTEGSLESFNIGASGEINGVYSNGQVLTLGQLALAKFSNSSGLTKAGNNLFQESINSGTANINVAGEGRGTIASGSLEMSNVDLSEEFTEMITAQRGFQANTRIITTSDEILQELVNLKR